MPVYLQNHYVTGIIRRGGDVVVVDSRPRPAWPAARRRRAVQAMFRLRDALRGCALLAVTAQAELSQRDTATCGVWSVMWAYACVAGHEPGRAWKPGVIPQRLMDSQRTLLAAMKSLNIIA